MLSSYHGVIINIFNASRQPTERRQNGPKTCRATHDSAPTCRVAPWSSYVFKSVSVRFSVKPLRFQSNFSQISHLLQPQTELPMLLRAGNGMINCGQKYHR